MGANDLFEAVSHPLRIEILKLLSQRASRFADIKRELKIESSGLLGFHLKKLDDLVTVDKEGCYIPTEKRVCCTSGSGSCVQVWLAKKSILRKSPSMYLLECLVLTSKPDSGFGYRITDNCSMDDILQLLDVNQKKDTL